MRRGCKVALVIGICVLLVLVVGVWRHAHRTVFDRAIWLSASGTDRTDNPRRPMAEDLQRRLLHKGMTRRQVEAIIGKPDSTSEYDRERGIEDYRLGYWSFLGDDVSDLQVYYDKHGTLIRTQIYDN